MKRIIVFLGVLALIAVVSAVDANCADVEEGASVDAAACNAVTEQSCALAPGAETNKKCVLCTATGVTQPNCNDAEKCEWDDQGNEGNGACIEKVAEASKPCDELSTSDGGVECKADGKCKWNDKDVTCVKACSELDDSTCGTGFQCEVKSGACADADPVEPSGSCADNDGNEDECLAQTGCEYNGEDKCVPKGDTPEPTNCADNDGNKDECDKLTGKCQYDEAKDKCEAVVAPTGCAVNDNNKEECEKDKKCHYHEDSKKCEEKDAAQVTGALALAAALIAVVAAVQ